MMETEGEEQWNVAVTGIPLDLTVEGSGGDFKRNEHVTWYSWFED